MLSLLLLWRRGSGSRRSSSRCAPEQQKHRLKHSQRLKLKLGQGDVEATASVCDIEEGSNAAFNLAGGIGWSGASLDLATQHGDWARLVAGDAQGAYDASTDAGMKALAVARGAQSTLVAEWEASTAQQKGKEPVEERVWTTEESWNVGRNELLSSLQKWPYHGGQLALLRQRRKEMEVSMHW